MENKIRALRAEGLSVREIARELGLSRMRVHRVLSASAPVPSVPAITTSVNIGADDPVLSLLTRLTWRAWACPLRVWLRGWARWSDFGCWVCRQGRRPATRPALCLIMGTGVRRGLDG